MRWKGIFEWIAGRFKGLNMGNHDGSRESSSACVHGSMIMSRTRFLNLGIPFVVKGKDTLWFVKFCVPWCKHCKILRSLWEDLEKDIQGEDGIEIGEVDFTTSKPLCSKVDIHSSPTFKLFYEGEEIAKYKGPRDVGSLKAFALEEADKAAKGEYGSENPHCKIDGCWEDVIFVPFSLFGDSGRTSRTEQNESVHEVS